MVNRRAQQIRAQQIDVVARLIVIEAAVGQMLRSKPSSPEIEREIRETVNVDSAALRRTLSGEDEQAFRLYVERAIGRLLDF